MSGTGRSDDEGDRRAGDVPDGQLGLGRLFAFTDGVFAIAITLLVLGLELPRGLQPAQLGGALRDELPQLFAAALSFVLIGVFWIAHHRLFDYVERADVTTLRLNLALLAPVVLLPFATDVLAEYGDLGLATIGYALVVAAIALLQAVIWRHVVRRGLVRSGLSPAFSRSVQVGQLQVAGVFLGSAAVALLSPAAAKYCWLLLIPLGWLTGRRAGNP